MAPAQCIHRFVLEQAERTPQAPAIGAPGRIALDYLGLSRQVGSTVERLNGLGLGRGDRVALLVPNGPEAAVAFVAIAAAVTCAPLNPDLSVRDLEFYLSSLKPKALIVAAGVETPARNVARSLGLAVLELSPLGGAGAGLFELGDPSGAPRARRRSPVLAGPAEPDDLALVLHTSGTTSRPKVVPLTHANLAVSAENIRRSLGLAAADRCLNVMPLFHVHGLVGATLSSLVAGASVFCAPGFAATRFPDWLDKFEPTWYTAVPAIHQVILGLAPGRLTRSGSLRFVRSCSSPLSPTTMAELETLFGAPVIEAYGMTEAAHQVATNPLPPGKRKPGSVGLPAGPEVAILDEDGRPVPPGRSGEICLRGANVMRGYEANPEANAKAFTRGWFRTGDQGRFDEEGYLQITGRLKEIINRGGEKISPREVDEVLLDHPAVGQAVAFAFPSPRLGEEVAAAVVLRQGRSATEGDLKTYAAGRLSHFKVPRRIYLVDEIPKGPTGKVQRVGLAQRLKELGLATIGRSGDGSRTTYVPPQTPVEKTLAAIWAEVLGVDQVGTNDDFLDDLGGDSLAATVIMAAVASVFKVDLPASAFLDSRTVGQLAEALAQALAQDQAESRAARGLTTIVTLNSGGSKPPLFLAHDPTGNVLFLRDFARRLGEDQPVYGLQPPGLDGQESPLDRLEPMATRYVTELRAVQPEGPYFLGGYCSGAVVAYEVARQLVGQGERVALLAMVEPVPPERPHRTSPLKWLLEQTIQRLDFHLSNLRVLPPGAWLAYAKERPGVRSLVARRPPGPQAAVEAGLRRALSTYVAPGYPGRAILFRSARRRLGWAHGHDYGWGDRVAGGIEVHMVPGTHWSIVNGPQASLLAGEFRACLDRLASSSAPG